MVAILQEMLVIAFSGQTRVAGAYFEHGTDGAEDDDCKHGDDDAEVGSVEWF